MTHDETIEKSRELDRALVEVVSQLNETGKKIMPPLTGGSGVLNIKGVLADARARIAKAAENLQNNLAAELDGMAKEIEANGALVVKKVRTERAEAVAEFNELLGNEHAAQTDDIAGKPQAGEGERQTVTAAETGDASTILNETPKL